MKPSAASTPFRASARTLAQTLSTAALLAIGSVQAATFTVTNCADTGVGSLRQAVESANTNPGDDVINFALNCPTITLASTIAIGATVNILGPGANALTITSPNSRALALVPLAAAPAFQEVTISGLRFAGSIANADQLYGGAIGAVRTNLAIRASVFDGNEAPAAGGAIYFQSTDGATRTLDIAYTSFLNNGRSVGFGGGAIDQLGTASVTIRRSLFRQNGTANVPAGGSIRSTNADALLIIDSGFYGNAANYGGAISTSGTGTSRVVGSSFVGNTGGGLALGSDFGGGAIDASLGALSIENSTFAANAINGTGVGSAIAARGSVITMLSTTIAKNEVRSSAATNAAVAVFSAPGLDNSVARLTLRNTVSSTNLATEAEKRHDVWLDGRGINSFFSSTTSLVSVLRNGGIVTQSPGGALLGNAENNGGFRVGEQTAFSEPLLTMLIAAGSALINTGNNADASALTTDQRGDGFPRIVATDVDIGAIEYTPLALNYTVSPRIDPASPANSGTLTPATDVTVSSGNTFAFTATPSAGFVVDTWSGTCDGVTSANNTIYTTNPASADCTVVVRFRALAVLPSESLPVPTHGQWALVLMALLLAGASGPALLRSAKH